MLPTDILFCSQSSPLIFSNGPLSCIVTLINLFPPASLSLPPAQPLFTQVFLKFKHSAFTPEIGPQRTACAKLKNTTPKSFSTRCGSQDAHTPHIPRKLIRNKALHPDRSQGTWAHRNMHLLHPQQPQVTLSNPFGIPNRSKYKLIDHLQRGIHNLFRVGVTSLRR